MAFDGKDLLCSVNSSRDSHPHLGLGRGGGSRVLKQKLAYFWRYIGLLLKICPHLQSALVLHPRLPLSVPNGHSLSGNRINESARLQQQRYTMSID